MPEQRYQQQPMSPGEHWRQFAGTFKGGISAIKLRPALIGILAAGFFYGFYSKGYDRLWQAHILGTFTIPGTGWFSPAYATPEMSAVYWNAAFKIVLMSLAVVATKAVEKRIDHAAMTSLVRMLIGLSTVLLVALLGFALAGNLIVSLILVLIIGVSREVIYPIYTTWVNHRLPSNVRATVLSFSSQVDAIGQTVGGPIVGVVAKQVSIMVGLLTSSAMLAPILPILWGQKKKDKEHLSVD
jgi:predicted MFS family arabinose efflux permease